MSNQFTDPAFGQRALPAGWSWHWLDEVMDIRGGAQPPASTFVQDLRPGYIRFVQIRDFDTDAHMTYIEDSEKWRKCSKTDILIARYGASLGRILRGIEGAYNVALVKAVPKKIDQSFLYYLLRSRFFQDPLAQFGARSAQSGFNKGDLSVIPVPVPPSKEQISIAQILGAFDAKIALNQRVSSTLEAVARALFKSWFVDFDPVRAKVDGRPSGLSADIDSLFPDSFEPSDHGEVPSGWHWDTIGTVLTVLDSKRIPLSSRERAQRKGPYPYYGAAAVMDHVDQFLFSGVHLLVGEDGSVARDDGSPVLQYVWGKFWVNNHAHVLLGKSPISTEHIYLALQRLNVNPYVTGAVQPKLNQGNLFRIPFLRATDRICVKFSELISPLFQRLRLAHDEVRSLTAIRDALIPKLLSGDIRVTDASKILEKSA